MKNRQTFKEIVKSVPKPTHLLDETVLPYVFDLHWDCKTGGDLKRLELLDNPTIKRLLAENGFGNDEHNGNRK
jgi:hypothetical protein